MLDGGTAAALHLERIPFRERRAAVLGAVDRLEVGEALMLVTEHMPLPLRFALEQWRPREFGWRYVRWGRPEWWIEVRRVRR